MVGSGSGSRHLGLCRQSANYRYPCAASRRFYMAHDVDPTFQSAMKCYEMAAGRHPACHLHHAIGRTRDLDPPCRVPVIRPVPSKVRTLLDLNSDSCTQSTAIISPPPQYDKKATDHRNSSLNCLAATVQEGQSNSFLGKTSSRLTSVVISPDDRILAVR